LIKILSPQTLPQLEYLSREDLSLSNVRTGGVREHATLTTKLRYPQPFVYPLGAENAHGEIEMLGDVVATHWYAEADGITWHFVTTGDPKNEPFVLVHGFPESWYTFHHQMRDLSDQFFCIAVDTLGNGQSDKRLDLNYRYSTIAESLGKLLDAIGIHRFNLGGHDRGSVICDHLLNVVGMQERVLRYIRMQQSANEPHGDPKPPHKVFAAPWFPKLMKWTGFPRVAYAASAYKVQDISSEVLTRLGYECKYKGIAEASPGNSTILVWNRNWPKVGYRSLRLTWTTANAEDFSHFELQRSPNGRGPWSVLAQPVLQTSGVHGYTDQSPLPSAYYRLKMVDLDGTFTYSEVVFLENYSGADAGAMKVYPNPSTGRFTVDLTGVGLFARAEGELRLVDLHGRVVWTRQVSTDQPTLPIELANARTGVYLLG